MVNLFQRCRAGLAAGLLLTTTLATAQLPTANRVVLTAPAELAADGTPFLIRLAGSSADRPAATEQQQVLRRQLGLGVGEELRPLRRETDALGFTHERYQQYYQGVKVEHGQYSVHSRGGRIEALGGELKRPVAGLGVRPTLGEAAALGRALAAVGARRYKWQEPAEEAALRQQTGDPQATYRPKGELVLVGDFRQPAASRPLVLAWKFNVYAQEPISRDLLYVDARTGQVVLRDAVIKHLNATGTLATRYLGSRQSTTEAFAGGYRLRETTRSKGITTLNCHRGTSFAAATDFVDNDNNWTAAEYNNAAFDNAALDAHLGAQTTQDYWVTQHGRDSYDNRGTVLLSYVHYSTSFDNAFWDGTEMVYGDGNTRFRPLTAVDVCGHEIGHAVCATTASLIYQNESGALNEGLSDIWGACVEHHLDPTKQNWLIGEDIALTRPSLRSMSDPNVERQPDTYLGTNWVTGGGDNGGVHTNSGVLNFWFYLLSVGGTGTNDFGTAYAVTGITMEKAARITYRAEQLYLTPSATYALARTATLQAAVDLYGFGSAEMTAAAQAWRAVGLGEATPTVGTLAPGSGPVGQVVVITGTNLSNVIGVTFNGTAATAGTLLSPTQLSVVVPAGASTGPVVVTTTGGAGSSAGVFTVTSTGPAPTISSYAPAGGQRTGAPVVITGTNFGGTSGVAFGGVPAVFTLNSPTQLTATVPAGASSGPLTVTTPGGTASAAFLVLPYLAGFAPASGAVGTAVTLTGTSFAGALNVKFNGVYAPFTVVSATSITTTVPMGASTGLLTVRTPSGTASSLSSFVVTPSLAVLSFTPGSGLPGTAVTIRGVGFTGATAVRFNGVTAAPFTVASDTELWATVPATASTGPIGVTGPLGTAASSASFVVLIPGAPVVSSFAPAYGVVGTVVTLSGSNFTGATAVRFNGVAATFSVSSATSITTTVPAGAGTGPISVSNAIGTGQSVSSFQVVVPPANDLCTASNLPVLRCGDILSGTTLGATATGDPTGSCTSVTLDGAGGVFYRFVGTGTSVTLATCGTVTNYDSELFVFTGTCGSYTCVTGDDDGCGSAGSSSTVTFASVLNTPYLVYVTGWSDREGNFTLSANCAAPPPVISSFAPASGPVGTTVTLTGSNFTAATALTFNGQAAAFTVVSATSITTTVPAGASTGPLRLTTPSGTAGSATPFTVVPLPVLTSLSPGSGPVGTAVAIAGTGLSGATAVTFGGTSANTVTTGLSVNAAGTLLTGVVVPNGATTGPVTVTTPAGTSNGLPFTVLTPASALVGSYSFAGNAQDGGGRAHHATASGGGFGPDRSCAGSAAYYLGGSPDYLDATTSPDYALTPANELTVSLWVKPRRVPDTSNPRDSVAVLFAKYLGNAPAQSNYYAALYRRAGVAYVRLSGQGTDALDLPLTGPIDGIWQQLTFVLKAGAGNTRIYRNGALLGSGTLSYNTVASAQPLLLGRYALALGSTYTYFQGGLDELRLYNRALAAAEVAGLYAAPAAGTLAAPVATASPASLLLGQSTTLSVSSPQAGTTYTWAGPGLSAATGLSVTATPLATGPSPYVLTATAGSCTASQTLSVAVALPPNLTVSSPQTLAGGLYNNLTITGPATGGAGVLTLTAPLTVAGTLTVLAGGTLRTSCQVLTGNSFVLAAGGTLHVCDPAGIAAAGTAAGAVQTVSRSFATGASYVYDGTLAQQTGTGLPGQVLNLILDNPQPVTLSQPGSVRQVLMLRGAGNFLLNGQAFMLLSDASGTALVHNQGTGVVVGMATMQRALAPGLNPGPGYRHYGSPVSNATVAGLATAGFTPTLNPAYNTATLAAPVRPYPTVFGYDEARLATGFGTDLPDFDRGFFSPAATDPLAPLTGYAVNIGASETVALRGTLNTGPLSRPSLRRGAGAQSGWQLLGNPYPAPLDFSQAGGVLRTNLDDAIYTYQSTGPTAGQYRAYVNGVGSPVVAAMQGFLARVSAGQTTGSLTLTNAARVTRFGLTFPSTWAATDLRPLLQLRLQGTASPLTDEAFVYFEAGATAAFDARFDAYKLLNTSNLSVSSLTATEELAVNGLPPLNGSATVPLALRVPASGSYTLAATLANFAPGLPVWLLDAQTGTRTDLTQQPQYAFTATTTALPGRFSLFFGLITDSRASAQAAQVQVFPNPAQGSFTLLLPAGWSHTPVAATLVNALGQAVLQRQLSSTQADALTSFDVSGLAAGVYSLCLNNGTTEVVKRVVLK